MHGPPILLERRHRIHDAIGADFGGIVVEHRHPGLDPGLDEERLGVEITFADLAQSGIERRHDGRNDDPVNRLSTSILSMANRLRKSTPYSSTVWVAMVATRQFATSCS